MNVGADREQLRGDGQEPPCTGTRGAIAARLVRSAPVYTSSPASSRPRSVRPVATTWPRGDRDDVGGRAADVDHQGVRVHGGDGERARQPVGRRDLGCARPRLHERDEVTGRRESKQLRAAQRRLRGVEHEFHALALRAERVRQLGGRGQRRRLHLLRRHARDDLAEHGRERLAVAPNLERP